VLRELYATRIYISIDRSSRDVSCFGTEEGFVRHCDTVSIRIFHEYKMCGHLRDINVPASTFDHAVINFCGL